MLLSYPKLSVVKVFPVLMCAGANVLRLIQALHLISMQQDDSTTGWLTANLCCTEYNTQSHELRSQLILL